MSADTCTTASVKKCPHCGQDLFCNPANIAACQCSQLSFTEEEKRFIENRGFSDCLCLDCLKALKEMASR